MFQDNTVGKDTAVIDKIAMSNSVDLSESFSYITRSPSLTTSECSMTISANKGFPVISMILSCQLTDN